MDMFPFQISGIGSIFSKTGKIAKEVAAQRDAMSPEEREIVAKKQEARRIIREGVFTITREISKQNPDVAIMIAGEEDKVLEVLKSIATNNLGVPLSPEMEIEYAKKFRGYANEGMTYDQIFDSINAEFVTATEAGDVAFYESRTGVKLDSSPANSTSNIIDNNIDPDLLPYVQKTAGVSGGNNMLIYTGIAAAGLFLLFGNKKKGKGLSGTPRKRKTSTKKRSRTIKKK